MSIISIPGLFMTAFALACVALFTSSKLGDQKIMSIIIIGLFMTGFALACVALYTSSK